MLLPDLLTLLDEMTPHLQKWALRRLYGHPDADDVVQTTLLKVVGNAEKICPETAKACIWQMLRFEIINYHRHYYRKGQLKFEDYADQELTVAPALDADDQRERCERIMAAVQQLPPGLRDSVLSQMENGKPLPGITVGAHYVRLGRGRQLLREKLLRDAG